MNKCTVIAALFFFANICRSTDLTVFGLEIGKPVQLPECEFVMIGKEMRDYISPVHQRTCVTVMRNFYSNAHARTLFFSYADEPKIVDQSKNATNLILDQNGALIGLQFPTSGISSQSTVLDQLTTKYGKPTESQATHVQNQLGAQFDVLHALWNLPGITVLFHGALTKIDEGFVTIDSPEAAKLRADALAHLNTGKSL
jgi:hypothetical protein